MDRNDISSNSWGTKDLCSKVEGRRRLMRNSGQRRRTSSCPFQSSLPDSPCSQSECDWTSTVTTACESRIKSYCTAHDNHLVDAYDPECDNWWHLSYTCSYTELSQTMVRSLQYAVTVGRQGKGTIFVFSAGNANHKGQDVNYEAMKFTRYTIAVGAVGKLGQHSLYSTAGSALLVSAPGGDHEFSHNHVVAQPGGTCQDAGVGTSFAAPVVSGVIALMLEANAALTWRDVQGILATTSSKTDPNDASWTTNAAGLHHSSKYGFGLVDAEAAVNASITWLAYGPEKLITATSTTATAVPQDGTTLTLTSSMSTSSPVIIEHVYVYLDLDHSKRGDLQLVLESPQGTEAVLIPGPRPEASVSSDTRNEPQECSASNDPCDYKDDGVCDYLDCGCDYTDCGCEAMPYDYGPAVWNWKMAMVRSWGEDPVGTWTLKVTDKRVADSHPTSTINQWSVFVYGHTLSSEAEGPSEDQCGEASNQGGGTANSSSNGTGVARTNTSGGTGAVAILAGIALAVIVVCAGALTCTLF